MYVVRAPTSLSVLVSSPDQLSSRYGGLARPLTLGSLLLLTCPFIGIQVIWVIQQAFGIPHLLTLGFTDSEVTLVLLAGPISGLVIPAVLTITGDGSRKSSIIYGGLAVILALLSLAWAQEVSSLFMLILNIKSESFKVSGARFTAVLAAYALNAAMQPLHISLRALLMDICPPQQQATASLWVTRLSASGSVLIASIAFFSSPSFKFLSVVCCTALSLLLALHSLEARYFYHLSEQKQSEKLRRWTIGAVVARTRQLISKATHLPDITYRVCRTQLFCWFGWFPALFYMGSVVSQSYTVSSERHGRSTQTEEAEVVSASAILKFHCVVLATTIALQMLSRARPRLSYSHIQDDGEVSAEDGYIQQSVTQLFRTWSSVLVTSAIAFAAVSLLSGLEGAAAVIIPSLGACFAVSNWVPYALLGIDLATEAQRAGTSENTELRLGRSHACDELDGATAILTIHSVAICIPQVASAVTCTLFFKLVERRGWKVDVSWVFLIASPAVLVAACDWETWRKR